MPALHGRHGGGGTVTRRYPLAPLEERGVTHRTVGTAGSNWARCRTEGIAEAIADRWAVAAGLHPGQVWPEWFGGVLSDKTLCGRKVGRAWRTASRDVTCPKCRLRGWPGDGRPGPRLADIYQQTDPHHQEVAS